MKGKEKQNKVEVNELQHVSGGATWVYDVKNPGKCYFTKKPGAEPRMYKDVYSLECNSNCWGCACYRKEWCVDRMHQISHGQTTYCQQEKPKYNT